MNLVWLVVCLGSPVSNQAQAQLFFEQNLFNPERTVSTDITFPDLMSSQRLEQPEDSDLSLRDVLETTAKQANIKLNQLSQGQDFSESDGTWHQFRVGFDGNLETITHFLSLLSHRTDAMHFENFNVHSRRLPKRKQGPGIQMALNGEMLLKLYRGDSAVERTFEAMIPLRLIFALAQTLPEQTYLTSLNYKENGRFVLQGETLNAEALGTALDLAGFSHELRRIIQNGVSQGKAQRFVLSRRLLPEKLPSLAE